jgi:hypothetical protein
MSVITRMLVTAVVVAVATTGSAAAEPNSERAAARTGAPDLIERALARGNVGVHADDRAGARTSIPTVVPRTAQSSRAFDWRAAGIGASVALGGFALALAALRVPRRLRGLAGAALMIAALTAVYAPTANAERGCVGTYSSHYAQLGLRDDVAHLYTQGNQPYSWVAQFHGDTVAACDSQVHGG